MEKAYKNCQSCGMPLKRDEKGGGTHKDGTKCCKYCSYCLVDGEFQSPEIGTAEKMQAFSLIEFFPILICIGKESYAKST